MRNRNFELFITITALIVILAACSSYEVQDIYKPVGAVPRYNHEDVQITALVTPGTRLFLTGPIGLPVVPTNLGSADKNIIYLKLVLELRKDHEFSILSRPCLHGSMNNILCPVSVDISATAMKQDDGSMYEDRQKRWDMVDRFSRPDDLNINLTSDPKLDRISRELIFSHYGYSRIHWDSLQVDMTFRYECNGDCPREIEFDSDDLASVDSVSIPGHKNKFVRMRENNYHVLAPL